MDLNAYFTIEDELEIRDIIYVFDSIKEYGFSIDITIDKLKSINNDKKALDCFIKQKDVILLILNDLSKYSFDKFPNCDGDNINQLGEPIEKSKKYLEHIANSNFDSIQVPTARKILEKIKIAPTIYSVGAFISDFTLYVEWLEKIIRKLEILKETSFDMIETEKKISDTSSTNKIQWLKRREDFIALFSALIEAEFILNKKPIYQHITDHFRWKEEEMDPENLKSAKSKVKNESSAHQISDELKSVLRRLIES